MECDLLGLTNELLLIITSYLPARALRALQSTCRTFYHVSLYFFFFFYVNLCVAQLLAHEVPHKKRSTALLEHQKETLLWMKMREANSRVWNPKVLALKKRQPIYFVVFVLLICYFCPPCFPLHHPFLLFPCLQYFALPMAAGQEPLVLDVVSQRVMSSPADATMHLGPGGLLCDSPGLGKTLV